MRTIKGFTCVALICFLLMGCSTTAQPKQETKVSQVATEPQKQDQNKTPSSNIVKEAVDKAQEADKNLQEILW